MTSTDENINSLDSDFKAEVVAAEMAETGIAADRILILMLGAMKRTYSKDVDIVEEELSDYDRNEYYIVKTHKEGIYDMLPEGLFHYVHSQKSSKTKKEIIDSIKQRKAEEHSARKFFLPFETAINYLRMQMALYENRLDKRLDYDELINIFSDHWEIFRYLDARQSNIFLHLIPVLHDVRDDHPVIEKIMDMIFMVPVKIILRHQSVMFNKEPVLSSMGESFVGVNLTTGNAHYFEGIDEILINIGPIKNEQLEAFMPGKKNQKILQLLIDYLLPAHIDVVTDFELLPADKITRLADKENDFNSTMGVSTYL